jgi:hypothetical protein
LPKIGVLESLTPSLFHGRMIFTDSHETISWSRMRKERLEIKNVCFLKSTSNQKSNTSTTPLLRPLEVYTNQCQPSI